MLKSSCLISEQTLPKDSRDSRLAGAEFLEVSADLYALVPFSDQQIGFKNQV